MVNTLTPVGRRRRVWLTAGIAALATVALPCVLRSLLLEIADSRVTDRQRGLQRAHDPPAADIFEHKLDDDVAWKSKPSWFIVAKDDHTVHPDLERFLAKRMGATTVEVDSSHVPMVSQPDVVIDVIRNAAATLQ
jgi:pimeloyl-ACP methyl ester carboxylesterase